MKSNTNLDVDFITTENTTIPKDFLMNWHRRTLIQAELTDGGIKQLLQAQEKEFGLKQTYYLQLEDLQLWLLIIFIAVKTEEFLISTTVFIILFELYETWWYQYRVSGYLKEFEGFAETAEH